MNRTVKELKAHALLLLCAFAFSFQSSWLFGQTPRGLLVGQGVTQELSVYFTTDSLLDLQQVRKVTDLLTNPTITSIAGKSVPSRKKAFIRHVKHLNEQLEESWVLKSKPDEHILEILYELEWYRRSFLQKVEAKDQLSISFQEKIFMLRSTVNSKRMFTYLIPKEQVIPIKEPVDSPFWHALPDSIRPFEQFDRLAQEKKIKPKKQMVVLASQYSNSGSGAKIETYDLDLDNKWLLKWGDEVHSDVVASRIFAGLGYDVDHPYHYNEDLTLVFDDTSVIRSLEIMVDSLIVQYGVDIRPFISKSGVVTEEMAFKNKKLLPFIGKNYVQFKDCALEARPDRVKRLGSIIPDEIGNAERQELNGALLAHQFIGNWDTREDNTVLTVVHQGNYQYRPSAVFSDLGTSLGVAVSWIHQDFKAGLVNHLDWEVTSVKRRKFRLTSRMNSILSCYDNASYSDLYWMAHKIGNLDETDLRKMIKEAHYPSAISELYFHKLASRRSSILQSFGIQDPHPIPFNRNLTIISDGKVLVKNGKLITDVEHDIHPEGFIGTKGRKRNYGRKK